MATNSGSISTRCVHTEASASPDCGREVCDRLSLRRVKKGEERTLRKAKNQKEGAGKVGGALTSSANDGGGLARLERMVSCRVFYAGPITRNIVAPKSCSEAPEVLKSCGLT